ncbi:MAG: DMT family transporter [Bacteroides sp.]|nr:DMT family transporter [Bacteroides sp.]
MKAGGIPGKNSQWLYHCFAMIVVIAWGLSFISTRVLLDNSLSPIEIYIYRFAIAYVSLLAICHKRIFASSLRDELMFVVCGLVAGSIYFISENVALEYTLVSNVSLITSLSPLLTVLMAGFIYKSSRPARGAYVGSTVAFVGVGLVIFNSSFNMSLNPIGDLLALLAALCWAVYSIMIKPLNAHYDARFITRKVFFYGIVTALPFLAVNSHITPLSVILRSEVLLNLLFLSLACSLGCYLLWALSVIRIGALKASNYLYFQPVVTLVFSMLILGEKITLVGGSGCLMILLGVWLSDFLQKRSWLR